MISQHDPARQQSGMILIEALLAILVFSLGILALVGLQAAAVKQSADAKYRTEAALLANEIIGQMWVSDRTTSVLQANFNSPGGATYVNWLGRVSGVLPGVVANSPTAPTIAIDAEGIATVTVAWNAPNEPAGTPPHQYVAIAQIR
jgi:type IV pilus assembly protein PilV